MRGQRQRDQIYSTQRPLNYYTLLFCYRKSCIPGHPGVGVNVKGVDGAGEKRRGLIYPYSHISTGVPLGLPILTVTVVAEP